MLADGDLSKDEDDMTPEERLAWLRDRVSDRLES
jgi:hypothetical protein